ncbi:MAG TPA: sulfotransferase [Jatrophihabitans sp.]|nr:sulfotransferase [Jatrophihabitans sp.]
MNARGLVPPAVQPLARAIYLGAARPTARWRMQPSFVVIGGQRCGTTTIFKTLAAHPQVVRPPVDKGTDYYTLHYAKGPSWYRSRFPLAGAAAWRRTRHGGPVAFEACTYYMFHPLAVERLARDLPDVKLVAMLRNPVERAFSAYKHEFARGFETEPDFRRALELEDERLAGELERLADPRYESFAHRHHSYRRRGQFAEQLRRVFEHFPREQVHIMDSEAFFADPAKQFQALVEFLDLTPWQPPTFVQYNARPSASMPADARAYLTEHYRPWDDELADLLGRQPAWRSL